MIFICSTLVTLTSRHFDTNQTCHLLWQLGIWPRAEGEEVWVGGGHPHIVQWNCPCVGELHYDAVHLTTQQGLREFTKCHLHIKSKQAANDCHTMKSNQPMQALRSTHVLAGPQQPTTVSFFKLLLSQVVSVFCVSFPFGKSGICLVSYTGNADEEILMTDHPSDPWPRTIPLSGPVSLDSEYAIRRGVSPQRMFSSM